LSFQVIAYTAALAGVAVEIKPAIRPRLRIRAEKAVFSLFLGIVPVATFLPPGRNRIPVNEDWNDWSCLGNSAINEGYFHIYLGSPNVVLYATPALRF
jgi:hypothetical protein